MSPRKIYEKRAEDFRVLTQRLQVKSDRLALARLITFIGGIILLVALSSFSVAAAVSCFLASMVAFAWLIVQFERSESQRKRCSHLEKINRLELRCLEGDFSEYKEGSVYSDREHPYSFDLDIFGRASLFQYINRTTSLPASDMLADYLKVGVSAHEISLRQGAVKDLSVMTDWRQEMMAQGYMIANADSNPEALLLWLESDDILENHRRLTAVSLCLSGLALIAITIVALGVPPVILTPVFLINFIFYFTLNKKINKLHQQVSRSSELLKAYSAIIGLIEKENFRAEKLISLKKSLENDSKASLLIRNLSKLVNRLDRRMNVLVSVPLNILFFNDIHCCVALEKWKKRYSKDIPAWFTAMAEFEVLSSLGNLSFNNPGWCFPEISDDFFGMKASKMGHPLIPYSRRVSNDFEIEDAGKTIIITGSNMSGKSTFLRTCGVNMVLAYAGGPVCAESFSVSLSQLFTSMRISDSLEDNTSSFYAELKRLRSVITEAEKDAKMFILLDEILRGTNSNDRFSGSVALLNQLSGYGTVTIVATHDLRLAEVSVEIKGKTDNYHFDVKVNGEELYFDYKINPGVCTSLNASILMKKMGIRM